MMTPTEFSSRLNASPRTFVRVNSTISLDMTLEMPYTRAMPSPTSRTLPTSRLSTCARYCWISSVRTDTISSALNLMATSLDELLFDGFEPRPDRQVHQLVAGLDLHPAQEFRIDLFDQHRLQVKVLGGQLLDPLALFVGERHGGAGKYSDALVVLVP